MLNILDDLAKHYAKCQIPSKSTDKLYLLVAALSILPKEVYENLQSFELSWLYVDEAHVPEIKVIFK